MEKEIKEKIDLLNKKKELIAPGWARQPYWTYKRKETKGGKLKTKEWDYYLVLSEKNKIGLAFTFSDLGYAALISISVIDFKERKSAGVSSIKPLSLHKLGLKESVTDDTDLTYSDSKLTLSIIKRGNKRNIIFSSPSLILPNNKKGIKGDLSFIEKEESESLNIATSWKENRSCFYYNTKIPTLSVVGSIWIGEEKIEFKGDETQGFLDYGRGRWTRKNTWYWASLGGIYNEKRYGINLGYGFSDREVASENAILFDGIIHKLGKVEFLVPENLENDWIIKDEDGSLDLKLKVNNVRKEYDNVLSVIISDQNQAFGTFSGFFTLENGEKIEIKDTYGFAEKVFNKW